jgi:hypothetical protein
LRHDYVLPRDRLICIILVTGRRNYAKDDKECCKDIDQTEGKRIEPWPKDDPPPPAWRYECPREPQPPNYDPYRIKVPDIVVPPLPPSNAKVFFDSNLNEKIIWNMYGFNEKLLV